jgi:hypothetical protein
MCNKLLDSTNACPHEVSPFIYTYYIYYKINHRLNCIASNAMDGNMGQRVLALDLEQGP